MSTKQIFRRQLFGYNRKEVDAAISALEIECKVAKDDTQRLETLAKENTNLAVELKIARSGFVDAAELLQAAQSRVRDLEKELSEQKRQLVEVSERLQEAALTNPLDAHTKELIALLQDRVQELGPDATKALHEMLSDADRLRSVVTLGDAGMLEQAYTMPQSFHEELSEEVSDARSLMQKIYRLRQK